MHLIDRWISRWASTIRTIYDAGYQIKINLSGEFDSRISFALALAAGIDFSANNVHVYSKHLCKKDGSLKDDYIIASSIAEEMISVFRCSI